MNRSPKSELFLLFSIFCVLSFAKAQTVEFEDPNLEKSIRSTLSKLDGELTESDLEDLVSLKASGIQSLKGLELAVNLSSAEFTDGNLTDLSPLEKLVELRSLNLSGRGIVDLNPISGLINLETLSIRVHSINDLSPISNLENLSRLELIDGSIVDLDPLSSLESLVNIDLSRNSIENIATLSGLQNLVTVTIDENRVSDLGPILGLDKLELISARSNSIENLDGFEGLTTSDGTRTTLDKLYLRDNLIESLEPLRGKLINYLDLSLNLISDLTPLPAIPRVGYGKVDVSYNYLDLSVGSEQLAVIERLSAGTGPGGQTLTIPPTYRPQNLDDAGITDEGLLNAVRIAIGKPEGEIIIHDIIDLTELEATDAGIADISGLEHTLKLERLDLSNNWIIDAGRLALLQRLAYLDLSDNQIRTLRHRNESRSLAWLSEIEHLDLSNNLLSSISLLSALTNLSYLDVSCNPIPFSEPREHNRNLDYIRNVIEANHAEIIYESDCYEDGVLYHKILEPSGEQLLFCHDGYELRYSGDLVNWRSVLAAEDILVTDGISTGRTQVKLRSHFEGTHFFRAQLE